MIIWYTVPVIWHMTDVVIFNFGLFFALSPPLTLPKNENFKKMKKKLGDIIILHKFTKNHDHMEYCSWDMAHDGCNYFSFWAIFCPFTAQKNQNFKKMKKFLKILSFYICAPKIMIRWCTVLEKWCTTDRQTEKVTHRGGCAT